MTEKFLEPKFLRQNSKCQKLSLFRAKNFTKKKKKKKIREIKYCDQKFCRSNFALQKSSALGTCLDVFSGNPALRVDFDGT